MPRASDLVQDSKLETKSISHGIGHDTHHVSYKSIVSKRQRRVRVDEIWRRESKIGNGTYGRVWLERCCSEWPTPGNLRAVKEITKKQANRTETDYTRELEAITKFSQAKYTYCFVRSFGWYEDDHSIYIAMEYMEHGDLQNRLIRPYPEIELRSIASQLLEGLQFMHENGFTHRDLKPGNILIQYPSPDWWVKISDFGISKRVDDELTSLRTMVGTRGYLAPEIIGLFPIADDPAAAEQITKESYTSAIDIWALGEICFKLTANRPAFLTPRELFNYVVLGQDFPWATLHNANASDNCINFIHLTMAASAVDRPSAADGLMCAWMKAEAEAEKELNGQSHLNAPQADAAGVAELQDYEATAAWSTLSGSPIKTPTSSAPTWHTRNSSSLSSNLHVKGRVFEGSPEVYKKQDEPSHPSSSGGREMVKATPFSVRTKGISLRAPSKSASYQPRTIQYPPPQWGQSPPLGDLRDLPTATATDKR